jgi:hypothetical protein
MNNRKKILTWIGVSGLAALILVSLIFFTKRETSDQDIVEIPSNSTERQELQDKTPRPPVLNKIEQKEKRIAALKNKITDLNNVITELEKLKNQSMQGEIKKDYEIDDPARPLPLGIYKQRDKKNKNESLAREKPVDGTEQFIREELTKIKAEIDRLETILIQEEVALGSTDLGNQLLLIDRILDSLELGNIAFNAPTSMNLKDIAQIQLLLSTQKSIRELGDMLIAAGEKEGARIQVSNCMEARLSGGGFQITAVTPEEQAIASKGVTEWKWEVKPKSPGLQQLHMTLNAIFNVDNTSMRRAIRTYDKTIEVEVTLGQRISGFIGKHWKWLWATIFIPVAGFIWRICKGHVEKNCKKQQKIKEEQ